MSDLKYTITKFDNENKVLIVTFENEGWAELRLTNPLPKNIEELEKLIKQFAAPIEAVEAQTNPDVDLSYIDSLVGANQITSRFQLIQPKEPEQTIDPETDAALKVWEDQKFQEKIKETLVKLGVLPEQAIGV